MKWVLIVALILNVLIEAPVGAFLILAPEAFLPPDQADQAFWARNYGVGAFSVACMSLWIWPKRNDFAALGVGLGFLITFHPILTVVLLASGVQPVGAVLHGVLAILFALAFFQRRRWCDPGPPGA